MSAKVLTAGFAISYAGMSQHISACNCSTAFQSAIMSGNESQSEITNMTTSFRVLLRFGESVSQGKTANLYVFRRRCAFCVIYELFVSPFATSSQLQCPRVVERATGQLAATGRRGISRRSLFLFPANKPREQYVPRARKINTPHEKNERTENKKGGGGGGEGRMSFSLYSHPLHS